MKKSSLKSQQTILPGIPVNLDDFLVVSNRLNKANPPPETQENNPDPSFLETGQKAEDGTIYLGFYRGSDWYTAAEDLKDDNGSKLVQDFNQAAGYAREAHIHGHMDWKLPEENILDIMFNNRERGIFYGTYEIDDRCYGTCAYWSSEENNHDGMGGSLAIQRDFSDGGKQQGEFAIKSTGGLVRLIREVPRPP